LSTIKVLLILRPAIPSNDAVQDEQADGEQDIQISGMINTSQLNKSLHTLDESHLQPLLVGSLGDSSNDPLNSFVFGGDGDLNEFNIDLGLEADLGWDLNFGQEESVLY
jgi:hypothetical protein